MPNPRSEEELWTALQDLDHALDARMPTVTVDAELVAAGLDPKALAAEGVQAAKQLTEAKRLAWQKAAQRKAETFAKRTSAPTDLGSLSRADLLTRLNVLRSDPRLGAPIVTAFRKRKPEESTVEDLRTLLEDVEALRSMGDDEEK